jgi:hypothetical protein
VAAERRALMSDARDSLGGPTLRLQQQPCIDRRLAEVRTVLERHRKGEPLKVVGPVSQPTPMSATRGSWQIALAGQALSHMPLKEKLEMSNAFGDYELWDATVAEDSRVWRRLAALNDADLLTDQGWSDVTAAYSEARVLSERLGRLAPFVLRGANLGIRPDNRIEVPFGFEAVERQICRPMIAR